MSETVQSEPVGLEDLSGTYFFGGPLDVDGVLLFTRSITISTDPAKSYVAINGGFWGSLVSNPQGPGPWTFSDNDRDFICISTCPMPRKSASSYITIAYLQYTQAVESDNPGDPTVTGVWLGTSNPPSPKIRDRSPM